MNEKRMDIEAFNAGEWQKTPNAFSYFRPSLVAYEWHWQDLKITQALDRATRALAKLDTFSAMVPDVDQFIALHVATEANTSSRIEGTRTEITEALVDDIELIADERRNDWLEVRNYIAALNFAMEELKKLPLSMRLACSIHRCLLSSGRGEHKYPGEIRKSQNWIGGTNPGNAHFVPPSFEELPRLLSDLEWLWNAEDLTPPLIRGAIAHYQFETIHPFCDGNGRLGRLMIPLHLMSVGLLEKPTLYVSRYFEQHRLEYYEALSLVRTHNRLDQWILFYLRAVEDTANDGANTLAKTLQLDTRITSYCVTLGRRASLARNAFLELYKTPRITVKGLMKKLHIDEMVARRLTAQLIKDGWLHQHVSSFDHRLKVYDFKPYLDIFGA